MNKNGKPYNEFLMRYLLIFFAFLGMFIHPISAQEKDAELKKMEIAWQIISSFYVDSVDSHEMTEEAIRGMLETLDPHSVYIPSEEVEAMNEPLEGNFEGVGIEFVILKDTLTVVATIPGGPSEKVGLMAGDQIVEIDGEEVAGHGLSKTDVFDLLRGPKGTEVRLGVIRGDDDLNFVVERDEIPIFSVEASYLLNEDAGYIKISRFAQSTHDEFKEALTGLKYKKISHLVLYLRGN